MSDQQYEKISTLMDGEIEGAGDALINAITADPEQADKWWRYHVISDAVRGDKTSLVDKELGDRISAAIADEPVVFSPASLKPARNSFSWQKSVAGLAIAASVAMVAVFTVQQGTDVNDASTDIQPVVQIADVQSLPPRMTTPARMTTLPVQLVNGQGRNAIMEVSPVNSSRLNSYMVNYNEFRTSGTTMQGMLPYVRIIANDVDNQQE